MLSVTISASWPRWMPCRSSPESRRGRAHLRPQLLVAARRADEDRGAGAQAEVDRVVGRGVAGVQGDHHVDRRRARTLRRSPSTKRRPAQPQRSATPLQKRDQVGTQLDAGHLGRDAEAPAQVLVHGEGQVALAGAVVDDADRRRAFAARRAGKASSAWSRTSRNLSICRHLRAIAGTSRWLRVGEAELGQERQVERQAARARAVVRARGRRRRAAPSSCRHLTGVGRSARRCRRSVALPFLLTSSCVSPPAACSVACANAGVRSGPSEAAISAMPASTPRLLRHVARRMGRRRTTAPARPSARSGGRGPASARRPPSRGFESTSDSNAPSSIARARRGEERGERLRDSAGRSGGGAEAGMDMQRRRREARLSAPRSERQSRLRLYPRPRHVRNRRLPVVRRRRHRLPDDPGPRQPRPHHVDRQGRPARRPGRDARRDRRRPGADVARGRRRRRPARRLPAGVSRASSGSAPATSPGSACACCSPSRATRRC